MKIKSWYYLSIIICLLILPILSLTFHRQYCYLTNSTFERIMRIEKLESNSNSKRKSQTIEGRINNQNVYFSLFDDDQSDFWSYSKNHANMPPDSIDYNNLKPLKLDVRVAQFGTSRNVLYIKYYETKDEAVKSFVLPYLIIEIIGFAITILLFIMYKKNNPN